MCGAAVYALYQSPWWLSWRAMLRWCFRRAEHFVANEHAQHFTLYFSLILAETLCALFCCSCCAFVRVYVCVCLTSECIVQMHEHDSKRWTDTHAHEACATSLRAERMLRCRYTSICIQSTYMETFVHLERINVECAFLRDGYVI